jgi:hypothetical protein
MHITVYIKMFPYNLLPKHSNTATLNFFRQQHPQILQNICLLGSYVNLMFIGTMRIEIYLFRYYGLIKMLMIYYM